MAQHRQAPRQFKEEPGHDSVSATLFFFLLFLAMQHSTHHRRFRHCLVIGQAITPCGSSAGSLTDPTEISRAALRVPRARDKSISTRVRQPRRGLRSRKPPHASRFRDFPCSTNPGPALQLFQKTACRCRIPGRERMRCGNYRGANLFHQQPGLRVACDRGRRRGTQRASALQGDALHGQGSSMMFWGLPAAQRSNPCS